METLSIFLYSKKEDHSFQITNNSQVARQIYIDLCLIFGSIDGDVIKFCPVQQMNGELRRRYSIFLDRYEGRYKGFRKLRIIMDGLSDGEFFLIFQEKIDDLFELNRVKNFLESVNTAKSEAEARKKLKELSNNVQKLFGGIIENYKIYAFGTKRKIYIGEPDKAKRICRFCSNGGFSENKVTFLKKAHAISEGLGNKNLIINEECDTCNAIFGDSIEEDLIAFLDVYRVMFKVKGKNGVPKIKNSSGEISYDTGSNLVTIIAKDIIYDADSNQKKIRIRSDTPIATANVYKALVKFAISVAPKETLINLSETIKWIKSANFEARELPKVAFAVCNKMYSETPELVLYIKTSNNKSLPHMIGEFKFKSLIFVYVVPFCSKDFVDFSIQDNYSEFWHTFNHYSSIKNWNYLELKGYKKSNFDYVINLQQA